MEVYLLLTGDYDGDAVEGVFHTVEGAQAAYAPSGTWSPDPEDPDARWWFAHQEKTAGTSATIERREVQP